VPISLLMYCDALCIVGAVSEHLHPKDNLMRSLGYEGGKAALDHQLI
jgi:hypothetical protein